ncbi:hypothetical protein H0A73_17495 [Alcaligenaceae bacterium]|nr:hypothetical protein [Alcaligenaceae bacterium]
MKAGSEIWFLHVLALALGKTVGEIQGMTHRELESWKKFYQLRPFDDVHRYHRPAAVIAHSMGGGGDIGRTIDMLINARETIAELEKALDGEFSEADKATIKALMG